MTTATIRAGSKLSEQVHEFVRRDFTPHFGRRKAQFASDELWRQFLDLGTELWLDSGDIEEIQSVWTREFTALTTNNSLLNQEVRKGTYDDLIAEAADLLGSFEDLTESEFILEMAFILNATHGLRLVEQFDAFVSVEEHTDLAQDVDRALEYARRYYAICPERFYVKIPFTPAGLLATRRARQEDIPINHTLGFSARQNYVITRLSSPTFVNVFLGRLNTFIAENNLGSGDYVGERATLASQQALRSLREGQGFDTRQIGASFRSWDQYVNLAGIDVITAPPKVARALRDKRSELPPLESQLEQNRAPGINEDIDPEEIGLDTLWFINDEVVRCVEALGDEDLDSYDPENLVDFFAERGCSDFMVHWSDAEVATSLQEGKIPRLEHWAEPLANRTIGLDSLMNLAGLNTFIADQKEMDDHVREVLKRTGARR